MLQIEEIPAKPKEQKTIRVAAYARVLSEKDAAFHSLEAQTEYYRNYVSAHSDWELVSIYSDNGISGTTIHRPEFQRMLQDCRDGKIDLVVTKSVTRFARNTVILLETIRELKRLGIDCYFEKEDMHSISPDGELLLTLLAMYAEEEARSASENQRWRIQKKFQNGEPWVGKMLGYRFKDGNLVVIPEEAAIVRQILGDSELNREKIFGKISRIIVPEHNHLFYELKNGSSVDVFWDHPSRSLSWTAEMREAARQKALKQHKKGGQSSIWHSAQRGNLQLDFLHPTTSCIRRLKDFGDITGNILHLLHSIIGQFDLILHPQILSLIRAKAEFRSIP